MLRTAGDLIRTLDEGTYQLSDLYARAEREGLADRPGGRDRVQDGQARYKRDVRNALQAHRRRGRAKRVDAGQAAWFIEGSSTRPRRALFVWLPRDPSQIELVLGKAAEILANAGEPIDLIVADPPYALERGNKNAGYQRTYRRNHDLVMDGYVEVDKAEYADFTAEWVQAAYAALRPGGYLAVITGPEQSADVQVAARAAGLTDVNSIVVPRKFGLYTTRRFVHQHWRITLATKGRLDSKKRVFHPPAWAPHGRNGGIYATDVWPAVAERQRRELLRYDNMLPVKLVDDVILCTTNPGDLVGDPFLGGGTTPESCLTHGRRFYGGDENPNSLRFTMGRLLDEVVPTLHAAERAGQQQHLPLDLDNWVAAILSDPTFFDPAIPA